MGVFVTNIKRRKNHPEGDIYVLYNSNKKEFKDVTELELKNLIRRNKNFLVNGELVLKKGKEEPVGNFVSYQQNDMSVYEIRGTTGSFKKFDKVTQPTGGIYTVIDFYEKRVGKEHYRYYTVINQNRKVSAISDRDLEKVITAGLVVNAKVNSYYDLSRGLLVITGINWSIPEKSEKELRTTKINRRLYTFFKQEYEGYSNEVDWRKLGEEAFERCKVYFKKKYTGEFYAGSADTWDSPGDPPEADIPEVKEVAKKFIEAGMAIFKEQHNITDIEIEDRVMERFKIPFLEFSDILWPNADVLNSDLEVDVQVADMLGFPGYDWDAPVYGEPPCYDRDDD